MAEKNKRKQDFESAANIIRDAGGKVVGRTRLQKIAYLLELAGVGDGFAFEYRHYGPYSEQLASAIQLAGLFELIEEKEFAATWGGFYSIYTTERDPDPSVAAPRQRLAKLAAKADPIELELAATAAFLFGEGVKKPWTETAKRKPEKVKGKRLENAKLLYRQLRKVDTPRELPKI